MTASVDGASQRESHSDWPPTWSASPFSQTGTDEPIETETKTLVPIVTVDETTTVYTMTGSEIITDGGQTLTLSPGDPITMTVNQPDETTIMETLNGFSTLSTAACGPKETDTVTKVVISTVYPDATSSSTASTSSSAEVTESTSTMTASSTSTETSTSIASSSPTLETVSSTLSTSTGVTTTWSTVVSGTITRTISINYNTTVTYTAIAESSTETTPCSTVTEAVTPVVSTGSVDGITNSGSSDTTSSSSGTPCTSTPVVTVTVVPSVSSSEVTSASSSTTPCTSTPTVIVTVLPTTATITTSSDDDYGIFVSTFITTITTRALHSHSISDISNSTSTTTVAPVIHPFAVNSTGEHNTTNIPLGPASPHGVVPSNFSMSSTTTTASAAHTHTTTVIPDVSKSGGAKTKTPVLGSRGNSGTDMFCVVMLVAVVSLVVTAI
ncbi:hypothetical protein F5Y04DRAFT_243687 [Hypomontagnella monticulosa]|nr:hypothetical protein F5Y04DRAFT_243687 [Hypomontagnella monticulosa]